MYFADHPPPHFHIITVADEARGGNSPILHLECYGLEDRTRVQFANGK